MYFSIFLTDWLEAINSCLVGMSIPKKQGDMIGGDDLIFINLDPFNNKRSGYLFLVSVNGIREDSIYEGPRDLEPDWDGI